MKPSAYRLPLPLNPAAAPVCCAAKGSADAQRRAGSQTGPDLGSAREKIREQPHYLLRLQRQIKQKHILPCSDSRHPAVEKRAFLLQTKPLSSAISDAASVCKERLLMCSPVDRADLQDSLWHLLYSQLRAVKQYSL